MRQSLFCLLITAFLRPLCDYIPIFLESRVSFCFIFEFSPQPGYTKQFVQIVDIDAVNQLFVGNDIGQHHSSNAGFQTKFDRIAREVVGIRISPILEKQLTVTQLRRSE